MIVSSIFLLIAGSSFVRFIQQLVWWSHWWAYFFRRLSLQPDMMTISISRHSFAGEFQICSLTIKEVWLIVITSIFLGWADCQPPVHCKYTNIKHPLDGLWFYLKINTDNTGSGGCLISSISKHIPTRYSHKIFPQFESNITLINILVDSFPKIFPQDSPFLVVLTSIHVGMSPILVSCHGMAMFQ